MVTAYTEYSYNKIPSDSEISASKREQLIQAAMRLEQNERYLALQEEKTRLLEEKRRAEEIERRKEKLKRIFSLYYVKKGAIAAAKVAGAITALLMLLREASFSSPVAARAYRGCIKILEQMLISVQHGAPIAKEMFFKVFGKISSAVKSVFKFMVQKASERIAKSKHDSAVIKRYIKRDAFYKLGGYSFRTDSSYLKQSSRHSCLASNYVNKAIRLHDRKYNDVIGMIAFHPLAVQLIQIYLLPLLKAAVISGVSGAVSGSLKSNVLDPIVKRIIANLKDIVEHKGEDETYIQAVGKKLNDDMQKLISILKKEKAFVASKIEAVWNKAKGLLRK